MQEEATEGTGEEHQDRCPEEAADVAAMFTRMWTDFASKMAMSTLSFAPSAAPPEAARQVRNSAFEALTQYYDELMRSPQFLETMKQSMDAAILMRQQFNAFLTRMHHEMQGTAREDIDSLMLTIRHVETRVLDRLDELTTRLDQMTQRLEKMNASKKGRGVEKAPAEPSPAGESQADRSDKRS